MIRPRWILLALAVLLAVAVAWLLLSRWPALDRLVDLDQPRHAPGLEVALAPGQPVGQTFVARHGGLVGIEFLLLPDGVATPTLTLHLRTEPQATEDLARASLRMTPGSGPGFYRFEFPAIRASHGQYAYAYLEADIPGVSVALAEGGSYIDGAAYRAHQPLDAQTTFRLAYAPGLVVFDLAKAVLGWLALAAVAVLLFVIPGWALLAWLLPGDHLVWPVMLGLSVGVSLAIYPILFLWTDLVGLHLGPLYAWLPPVAGLLALAWRYRDWRPRRGWQAVRRWWRSDTLWPDLALLLLLALVFSVRFLVIRTLDAPMLGDSYQHTMIAQLLADNGGLFDSWAPYAALDRFSYHFGFHSTVAALHYVTKLPMEKATLWMGQIVNGLAVLTLYPLAVRVTGSRWGGVWAVLLAGLLSPMPMYYVNWGRYTQLAGQAILPVAAWLAWDAIELPERQWGLLALAALVGGGLALTHYRVLLFYIVFVLALSLISMRRGVWRETLLRLTCIGLGAGLLFLPRFVQTFGSTLLAFFWRQATTPPSKAPPFMFEYNAMSRLDLYLAPFWWLALLLGLGLGLWQRRRSALLVGLWWLLLLVATNPAWLSLPGTGAISNFALLMATYLPAALLSGILFTALVQRFADRRWRSALLVLVLLFLAFWGTWDRMGDLNPKQHALVTRPDARAAAWIQENVPPDALFLINSFLAFGDSTVVGSDGGWWLPLLAGRQITVPPINYASELGLDSNYRQQVDKLAQNMQAHDTDDPVMLNMLQQQRVTHVYLGQGQGRVFNSGEQVIEPERLVASPYYDLIYHQDRVWIFEINPRAFVPD